MQYISENKKQVGILIVNDVEYFVGKFKSIGRKSKDENVTDRINIIFSELPDLNRFISRNHFEINTDTIPTIKVTSKNGLFLNAEFVSKGNSIVADGR
ncbi:hypothetical protein A3Q56_01523 [Intoshia linei]|uniref:FHA domain-containing protein n=1 Tax=Intoshia linei TaxID=1819745 RepID=A0A177B8U1_9BILA|nr:hypothetical protein A3Q56_01523 [Intoshia linei]